MNRSNLVRGAIALTIPCLFLACTRSSAEKAEEERREAERAQVEANTERREAEKAQIEANAERRHDLEEARTDPKIQANEPESNVPANREPTTNATDTVKGLAASSVRLITEARCHREEKCGNIGPGEKYASDSICQQKIGADWQQELNSYDCPGGVVVKELNECLEEIKNENCSSPFDTLGRIVACRSSDICKSVK